MRHGATHTHMHTLVPSEYECVIQHHSLIHMYAMHLFFLSLHVFFYFSSFFVFICTILMYATQHYSCMCGACVVYDCEMRGIHESMYIYNDACVAYECDMCSIYESMYIYRDTCVAYACGMCGIHESIYTYDAACMACGIPRI